MSVDPVAKHPVLACIDTLDRALTEVADVDPTYMTVPEQRQALVAVSALTDRVAELRLRLIATSGEVARLEGHRDIASWLTHRTRADRSSDRRAQRLAEALERRWHSVRTALAQGGVNLDQAQVITRALDALPHDLDPDLTRKAESHLIEQAALFGPRDLRVLGRRILDVIAPEIGDDHEQAALEAEERRARRRTWLSVRPLGDGAALVRGRIPETLATRLTTYLEAFTSPRHCAGSTASRADQDTTPNTASDTDPHTGPDSGPAPSAAADGDAAPASTDAGAGSATDRRPYEVRLGHAFCSLLESIDPDRLPLHGGTATTLVITMDLQRLMAGTGAATLPDAGRLSAGDVRRLACNASLVPAVLGTASEPLDLGRANRLFSPAQRRALGIRDRRCRADGCTIPAAWTQAHHLDPWSRGGKTDLADGVLLCSHHHHLIHDDRYLHERLPNGDFRFHRRR